MKKEKRVLQAGDRVKVYALANWNGPGFHEGRKGTISQNPTGGSIIVKLDNYELPSGPVHGLKIEVYPEQIRLLKKVKKKKQPRVISDERFFVNNYIKNGTTNSCLHRSIDEGKFVSVHCDVKEILELGIVAIHEVKK